MFCLLAYKMRIKKNIVNARKTLHYISFRNSVRQYNLKMLNKNERCQIMGSERVSVTVKGYANGYSVKNISCRDVAYATAAGAFSPELYYQYCYLKSIYVNWGAEKHIEQNRKALRDIGISENKCPVLNTSELLQVAVQSLKNNQQVIVALRDRYCFFCEQYKESHNAYHFVLLTGIDFQKGTVTLMEYMHLRESLAGLTDADFMCKLVIPVDNFFYIWEASNQSFSDRPDIQNNIIIIQQETTVECSPKKMLEILITAMKTHKNDLCRLVYEYNDSKHEINEMMEERTSYIGNVQVIFDLIKKHVGNTPIDSFREDYLSCRDRIIATLHASVMRNKPLSIAQIKSLCESVTQSDITLLDLLLQAYKTTGNGNVIYPST